MQYPNSIEVIELPHDTAIHSEVKGLYQRWLEIEPTFHFENLDHQILSEIVHSEIVHAAPDQSGQIAIVAGFPTLQLAAATRSSIHAIVHRNLDADELFELSRRHFLMLSFVTQKKREPLARQSHELLSLYVRNQSDGKLKSRNILSARKMARDLKIPRHWLGEERVWRAAPKSSGGVPTDLAAEFVARAINRGRPPKAGEHHG